MDSASCSRSNDERFMMGGRCLSKEVVCKILGKLPMRSFLQLRVVCKLWNTILDDIEFQNVSYANKIQNVTTSNSVPFLLWEADCSRLLLSFDLQLRKWRPFHLLRSIQASVISSTRGLFLTIQQSLEGKNIYVLNPLTKVERLIPSLDWTEFEVRQMVVDDKGLGKYYIIGEQIKKPKDCELARSQLRVQIYDSTRKQWFMTRGFPVGFRFKNACALNGHLLFLAHNHIAVDSRNVVLYVFDGIGSLKMYGLDVPVCIGPAFRQWIPRLFGSRGRLMLIGETETCGRGVFIWQLNPSAYQWEKKHQMPNQLFEGSVGSYDFLACEDYICVHPCRLEKNRAIIGKLATRSWHVLPTISPPLYVGRTAFIFDRFCFYEPTAGAKV